MLHTDVLLLRHFIRLPRMLRVSSRVAVRVAVLTALFVTFLPIDSLDLVFFPVTVLATCVPMAAVTLVTTAERILKWQK